MRNAPAMSIEEEFNYLKRGSEIIVTPEDLMAKLKRSRQKNEPLIVKLGLDPTAPDIHLGHTVVLRKLRHFQDMGHTATLIIGDFTGRIGDPTGKDKTRAPITETQVLENAKTYQNQAGKILDIEKLKLVFNSHWLKKLTLEDVMKMMSYFTMSRMLEHNTFKTRFESSASIRLNEFMYPFLQGFDSVEIGADVELGGSDQTFNTTFGRDMQKCYEQEAQVALLLPILRGTDGVEKMSKSLGNYIGINEPPFVMFEKIMNMTDSNIVEYYTLLTDVPVEEIQKIEKDMKDPGFTGARDVKMRLGAIIVEQYHGAEAAKKAVESYGTTAPEGTATYNVQPADLKNGKLWIVKLLTLVKFAPSNGEARRLVDSGAVKIDGEKVTNPDLELDPPQDFTLRVGKNKVVKVVFK